MGSMTVDPLSYMQLTINSLEIIRNFMHSPNAYRNVLALVRSGGLDVAAITPKVFPSQTFRPQWTRRQAPEVSDAS